MRMLPWGADSAVMRTKHAVHINILSTENAGLAVDLVCLSPECDLALDEYGRRHCMRGATALAVGGRVVGGEGALEWAEVDIAMPLTAGKGC